MGVSENAHNVLLAKLLMSAVLIKAVNLTFENMTILPENIERYILIVSILIFFAEIFKYIKKFFSRINILVLTFFVFFTLLHLYAFLAYPDIKDTVIKRAIWTTVFGTACFASFLSISDMEIFFDEIYKWSFLLTVLGILFFIGDTGKMSSSMTFSNMMLFPFCIHCVKIYKTCSIRTKILVLALAALELSMIFIHGSRGSLIYAVFYITVLYFRNNVSRKKYKILIALFVLLLLPLISSRDTLETVMHVAINHRYGYIRNLDLISSKSFFYDNGRYVIWQKYFHRIITRFPIQLTVADDFMISYPHNVFIEIMYTYGYALGMFIILYIIVSILRIYRHTHGFEFNFFLMILVGGLFPLLTSFTYFEWPLFWGFLGFLVSNNAIKIRVLPDYPCNAASYLDDKKKGNCR